MLFVQIKKFDGEKIEWKNVVMLERLSKRRIWSKKLLRPRLSVIKVGTLFVRLLFFFRAHSSPKRKFFWVLLTIVFQTSHQTVLEFSTYLIWNEDWFLGLHYSISFASNDDKLVESSKRLKLCYSSCLMSKCFCAKSIFWWIAVFILLQEWSFP